MLVESLNLRLQFSKSIDCTQALLKWLHSNRQSKSDCHISRTSKMICREESSQRIILTRQFSEWNSPTTILPALRLRHFQLNSLNEFLFHSFKTLLSLWASCSLEVDRRIGCFQWQLSLGAKSVRITGELLRIRRLKMT